MPLTLPFRAAKFQPGDLVSTTTFQTAEIYPLCVVENEVADENKLVTLFSSSGRLTYASGTFLRFQRPGFAVERDDPLKLQAQLRVFSRSVNSLLREKIGQIESAARAIAHASGTVFEDEVCREVFGSDPETEAAFTVHKAMYEASFLVKDSQWIMSPNGGSGPYTTAPDRIRQLVAEAASVFDSSVKAFREKAEVALSSRQPPGLTTWTEDELKLIRVVEAFANQHYMNATGPAAELRTLSSEILLGIAFVNSQAEARKVLAKLLLNTPQSEPSHSRAYLNSFAAHQKPVGPETGPMLIVDSAPERKDFDQLPVLTIDPPGTTEVDDGISVESLSDSEVRLFIHVADPSSFFPAQSELEFGARRAVSSIYLPELTVPMLPSGITERASLDRRNGRALTFSCKFDLSSGSVSEGAIDASIVRNIRSLTYDEAEASDCSQLKLLQRVALRHYELRKENGFIDIQMPRGQARLDRDTGKVSVTVDAAKPGSSRQIVSEMMIIAGRIAAESAASKGILLPFRYHEGYPQEGKTVETIYEKFQLLRQMPSSAIDLVPRPHKAMGVDAYCKVTSPLRRYLDLVAHRQLRNPQAYSAEALRKALPELFKREQCIKRLGQAANRYWIEKHLYDLKTEQAWSLHLLDRISSSAKHTKEMFLVHIEEVASNFMVILDGRSGSTALEERITALLRPEPRGSVLHFQAVS